MWFRKNSTRTSQGRGLCWRELLWSLSWTRKGRAPWSRRQTPTYVVCPGRAPTVSYTRRRPLPLLRSTVLFLWVKLWLLPLRPKKTSSRPGQPRPSASGRSLPGVWYRGGTPKRSTVPPNINWIWRLDTSFSVRHRLQVFSSLKETEEGGKHSNNVVSKLRKTRAFNTQTSQSAKYSFKCLSNSQTLEWQIQGSWEYPLSLANTQSHDSSAYSETLKSECAFFFLLILSSVGVETWRNIWRLVVVWLGHWKWLESVLQNHLQ